MRHPNKLQHFRLLNGLTEKQVAKYLGIKNEITITRWENSEAMPKNSYLVLKLAILYKVMIFDLYPSQYMSAQNEIAANTKKRGIPRVKSLSRSS